jgi:Tol biopolymer transport system component
MVLSLMIAALACSNQGQSPPTPIPSGILVDEIPRRMDIIFDSVRHILNDPACLDETYNVDPNFMNVPACNALIYDPQGNNLASPRQLFAMDIESGEVVQITNTDCIHVIGQLVEPTVIMTMAICADTDASGLITESDKSEIYLLDLATDELVCLTCEYPLTSINNADYSRVRREVVFSAQPESEFHNYLYRIDLDKRITQITNHPDYMDFDCAWSADGTKIVFNRLPAPWLETPSQVWLMSFDGTDLVQLTEGGPNPNGEENLGSYPIGIDADPDLSPDNQKVVFSRLRTGRENVPFGVYELVIVDVETKEIEILDSQYANMVPQWKSGGILINRQVGVLDLEHMRFTDLRQSLYVYRDGQFEELEEYPFNVFPLGAFGGYWIDWE